MNPLHVAFVLGLFIYTCSFLLFVNAWVHFLSFSHSSHSTNLLPNQDQNIVTMLNSLLSINCTFMQQFVQQTPSHLLISSSSLLENCTVLVVHLCHLCCSEYYVAQDCM